MDAIWLIILVLAIIFLGGLFIRISAAILYLLLVVAIALAIFRLLRL